VLGVLFLLLLIPDVLSDDGFIEPDGTHAVPSGPEMEPCEGAHTPQIFAVNADRRFSFQPADRIGHTVLRRNAHTEVHMIRHRMAFDQLDAHLVTEFPEDLADIFPERAKDCLLAVFWYDDKVVSAIPPDMALVLPFSHGVVSPSHGLGGSMTGETTLLFPNQRRNGRASSSLTARGGGLPIGVRVTFEHTPSGAKLLDAVRHEGYHSLGQLV
jgi:hypothetical protein